MRMCADAAARRRALLHRPCILSLLSCREFVDCVCVQSLTATGITICATIHSPSPRTFELFERCALSMSLDSMATAGNFLVLPSPP